MKDLRRFVSRHAYALAEGKGNKGKGRGGSLGSVSDDVGLLRHSSPASDHPPAFGFWWPLVEGQGVQPTPIRPFRSRVTNADSERKTSADHRPKRLRP